MKKKTVLILIATTIAMTINGQNLKEHLWKNRVILIIANDTKSQNYASQLEEFNVNIREFEERKLIIYNVLPHKHKIENREDNSWVEDSDVYSKYNPSNNNFRLILIGLDGSIKINQNEILTANTLFSTIDAMPMRRTEIKNKP